MNYKLMNKINPMSVECVLRINDDESFTVIVCIEESRDYQAYLKWLEEGNEPLPADEVIDTSII